MPWQQNKRTGEWREVGANGQPMQGPQPGAIPIGPRNTQAKDAGARADRSDRREQARFEQQQREWHAKFNDDGTPKVAMPTMLGDGSKQGAEYLTTLPQNMRNRVQQLIDGRSILTAREKGTPLGQQLMDAANQADPTFDEAASHARFTARNQFTGMGKASSIVQAGERLANHASHAAKLSAELGGPDLGFSPLSNAVGAVRNTFHQKQATAYSEYLPVLAGEVQKLTKVGAATVDESKHIMAGLQPYQPKDVRDAALAELLKMADAQRAPLRQAWESAWSGSTAPPMPMDFSPATNKVIDAANAGDDDPFKAVVGMNKSNPSNPFGGLPGKGGGTPGLYDGNGNFTGQDPRIQDHGAFDASGNYLGLTGEVHDDSSRDAQGRLHAPDGSIILEGEVQGGPGYDEPQAAPANPYEQYLKDQLGKYGMGDPNSASNYGDRAQHGLLASLDDEFAGVGGGLGYALTGRNPLTGYQVNRDLARMQQHVNEGGQGAGGTALEIASSIPTALMMGGGGGIRGAMANGARFGATEGFGRGSGVTGSALGTVGGAIGGTVGGGIGGAVGKYAVAPIARRLTNLPAAKAVLDRVTNGRFEPVPNPTPLEGAFNKTGMDVSGVQANLQSAQDHGLPYSLADADPRLRLLAGSVSRQSPETGAVAENYLEPRQMGQIDRLRQSIGDNLAPETDIAQRGKDLLSAGNTASSPFYEAANMRAAPIDDELKAMLQTRDGQDALTRARGIAENYGRDPNKMGFNLDNQGEVSIENNPSFETLDMVKRGFDAKIYEGNNPITGKPDLAGNPQLRALNDYRHRFVNKLDSLNPDYPKARAEYAKFAQQKDALDRGYKALPNALPRDMQAAVAQATPDTLPEMQRGYATALSDRAQKLTDTRDPFKAVYGNPAAREKIAALFPQGAPRFDQHYGLEGDMAKTAREVLGGSQTAQRQGMDAAYSSMAMPAEIAGSLHGMPGAGTATLKGLSYLTQRGIKGAARKNAEQLAPVLFNDAQKVNAIGLIQEMLANNAKRAGAANATARRSGMFGSILAPVPSLDSR